jgi:hypothetical protein
MKIRPVGAQFLHAVIQTGRLSDTMKLNSRFSQFREEGSKFLTGNRKQFLSCPTRSLGTIPTGLRISSHNPIG